MKNKARVKGSTDQKLLQLTIGELLARAAGADPDGEALVSCHQNVRLTFTQLDERSAQFARGLASLGLIRGERIGIWSPNTVEWIVTLFAAAKLGLVLVNVNPAYRPSELEYALNKVGCKALVMAERFKTSDYPGMLRKLAPEIDAARPGALAAAALSALRLPIVIAPSAAPGFLTFADVERRGMSADVDLAKRAAGLGVDEPVNIQFTSGTTGSPKGATLTHYNVVNNATFVGNGIGLGRNDRLCLPVPLYHCFGMVMGVLACVSHGATLVLPDEAFDPLSTLEAVACEKCTALYGVPTMFGAILEHPDFDAFDVRHLRTGIVAGSLCSPNLMQKIFGNLNMREVTNCYGMTETSPVSFPDGHRRFNGQAHDDRRQSPSPCRGEDHRSRRADRRSRGARRDLHAWLQRHAGLLE